MHILRMKSEETQNNLVLVGKSGRNAFIFYQKTLWNLILRKINLLSLFVR